MPVNILLADDHRMVREGLKQLLEMDDNINVVSEAQFCGFSPFAYHID